MRTDKLLLIPVVILYFTLGPIIIYGQSLEENVRAGAKALAQNQFPDAERHLCAALKQAEEQKLEDATMQRILYSLADLYLQQKKYTEAEQYFKQLLNLMAKTSRFC